MPQKRCVTSRVDRNFKFELEWIGSIAQLKSECKTRNKISISLLRRAKVLGAGDNQPSTAIAKTVLRSDAYASAMWLDRDMARNHCLLLGWSTFPYSTWDVLNGKILKDQLSILSCRLYEHFIWSGANRGSIESRCQLKKAAANWLILSFIFINRNLNSNFLFCGSDPKPISIRIHRNNLGQSRNPSRRNDDV